MTWQALSGRSFLWTGLANSWLVYRSAEAKSSKELASSHQPKITAELTPVRLPFRMEFPPQKRLPPRHPACRFLRSTVMARVFSRPILVAQLTLLVCALCNVKIASAQPSVTKLVPMGIAPGKTTEMRIEGARLNGPLNAWTSFPARVETPPADAKKGDGKAAVCKLSLSPNVPVGIGGMAIATPEGASDVMGRGIVDPPDDFRESNPPSNAALLEALANDFRDHGFDRKHLLRVILNSRTYQSDFRPAEGSKDEVKYFSHYQPRLLSAEQLLDAICAVTDLPESFSGLPTGMKATQLPAPDLAKNDFLKIFGQPERQTVCACERTSDSNLGMAIQFFNGPLIHGKLRDDNNRFRKLLTAKTSPEEIVRQLYLAAVCREPNANELRASLSHLENKKDEVTAFEDIAWAILNTNEFLFQH